MIIREKHIKAWLREATWESQPIRNRWEVVVSMIHLELREGHLSEKTDMDYHDTAPKGEGEI